MPGAGQRRRDRRRRVPGACVELGLSEEDAPVELGCAQIGGPQISPQQISLVQVRASKVGPEQVGPVKADAAQVRALELGPDQVDAAAIGSAVTDLGAHRLADPFQQRADLPPVCGGVEENEFVRTSAGEAFALPLSSLKLVVQLTGWLERQGFGQLPQQLMELSHHGEDREHRRRARRVLSPVAPTESHLNDLLASTKAVEHSTAGKTPFAEVVVDAAAEVRAQVRARLSRRLVDREVGRRRENRRDATQPRAAAAVRPQLLTPVGVLGSLGHESAFRRSLCLGTRLGPDSYQLLEADLRRQALL